MQGLGVDNSRVGSAKRRGGGCSTRSIEDRAALGHPVHLAQLLALALVPQPAIELLLRPPCEPPSSLVARELVRALDDGCAGGDSRCTQAGCRVDGEDEGVGSCEGQGGERRIGRRGEGEDAVVDEERCRRGARQCRLAVKKQ